MPYACTSPKVATGMAELRMNRFWAAALRISTWKRQVRRANGLLGDHSAQYEA
jgi:hypothetical protein